MLYCITLFISLILRKITLLLVSSLNLHLSGVIVLPQAENNRSTEALDIGIDKYFLANTANTGNFFLLSCHHKRSVDEESLTPVTNKKAFNSSLMVVIIFRTCLGFVAISEIDVLGLLLGPCTAILSLRICLLT